MSLAKKESSRYEYFIVLDFEATCDKDRNASLTVQEIIEWPAMIIDIKTKQIIKTKFHKYITPQIHPKLTPFCINLTGITQEMVNKGKTIINTVNEWNKFCINNKLIIKKDKKIIDNACVITCGDWDLAKMWPMQQKIDKKIPNAYLFNKWINIQIICRKYYGNGMKCNGMMNLLKCLNIKHVGKHHSGIDDVRNICNIVIHMLNDENKNIDWYPTSNKDQKFIDTWKSNAINKKPGDWKCPSCDYLNFSSRDVCNSCSIAKPKSLGKSKKHNERNGKPWKCNECNYFNFGSRDICKRCDKGKKPKNNSNPNNIKKNAIERKEGDWDCDNCGTMNFKFRRFCMQCQSIKPKNENDSKKDALIERKKGDWDCIECNTLNFSFRKECFGCGKPKKVKNNDNDEMKENENKNEICDENITKSDKHKSKDVTK